MESRYHSLNRSTLVVGWWEILKNHAWRQFSSPRLETNTPFVFTNEVDWDFCKSATNLLRIGGLLVAWWWTATFIDKSLAQWTFHARCPNQGCLARLYDQPLLEGKTMRKSTEVETRPAWATHSFATPFRAVRVMRRFWLHALCWPRTRVRDRRRRSSPKRLARLRSPAPDRETLTRVRTNATQFAVKSALPKTCPAEITTTCDDKDSDPPQKMELHRPAWPLRALWC